MVVLDLKHLKEAVESSPLPGASAPAVSPQDVASQILSSIQRHVLKGDAFLDLSEAVDTIAAGLRAETEPSHLLRYAAELSSVLDTFQQRVTEANQETAENFRKVLGLVNESFSYLQAGNEKADGRLKYFEQSLNEAAKIDSLNSLRRHLSGMLDFVHKEGRRDVAEKDRQMQSMSDQIREAQAESSRYRVHLAGRFEAVEHLRRITAAAADSANHYVTLFNIDSLKALRARHGEELATTILEELGRKQIQPLAPEGQLFCWSGTSLILTWKHSFGATSPSLLHPAPAVFEHRAFIGTRMATFRMTVRAASTLITGDLDDLLGTLDRLGKERPT